MDFNLSEMKNIFFLIVFMFSVFAFGQTLDSLQKLNEQQGAPLNSDRPGATYSANVVGKRALMTQLGFDIGGHQSYKWDATSAYVSGVFNLRYGLTDRLELGTFIYTISNNIDSDVIEDAERNLTAYSLNLRYTALSNDRNSLGFLTDVAYGYDRKDEFWIYTAKALYAVSFNKVVGLSSNLGYNYSEGSSWVNYTLNLGFSLYDDFGFYVEGFGDIFNSGNVFWIDGGIWYLVGPNLQLDMLFAKGFNNNIQNITGSIGLTWRIIEPK